MTGCFILFYFIYVISYIVELTLFVCAWRWSCNFYTGAVGDIGDAANTRDRERG